MLDEKGWVVSPHKERIEQYMVQFIPKESCVLELGGRYGSVSYCIQKHLVNSNHHVVVEPDEVVLECLIYNLRGTQATIFNGVISRYDMYIDAGSGLGTTTTTVEKGKKVKRVDSIGEVSPGAPFDFLVIDCEECYMDFLQQNEEYVKRHISGILIEIDGSVGVINILKSWGFFEVLAINPHAIILPAYYLFQKG
jgi:FkbM family methyltransferase